MLRLCLSDPLHHSILCPDLNFEAGRPGRGRRGHHQLDHRRQHRRHVRPLLQQVRPQAEVELPHVTQRSSHW